jgi:hypothetical protein
MGRDDREGSTFVWGKKIEKQGLKSLSKRELERMTQKKQQVNIYLFFLKISTFNIL